MTSGLGNITNLVSPEQLSESRHKRQLLREHSASLLPNDRVSWCMKKLLSNTSVVVLMHSESHHKASLRNVMMCGSVWTCPVCSLKISEIRRAELQKALEHKSNLLPVMITFTIRHNVSEPLKPMVKALKDSWRKLKAGKAWLATKERFKLVHYVSCFEIRHGKAGWHPHFHVLAFLDLSESNFKPDEMKSALLGRYKALLAKHGKYILDDVGLHVQACSGSKELGEYMSKLSMQYEISKSASKLGRDDESFSPFQLLARSMAGDAYAGALYKEYAECMSGRKFIQWSRGARAYFELDVELTDEELASQPEPEPDDIRELMRFDFATFKVISKKCLLPGLLRIADSGDVSSILAFLEKHGIKMEPVLVEVCT